MNYTISGVVHEQGLSASKRRVVVAVIPFDAASQITQAIVYNAQTGKGQQRAVHDGHCRVLEKAIRSGTFTPSAAAAHLTPRHLQAAVFDEDRDGRATFRLKVDADDPLLLTDFGHRMEAMRRIRADYDAKMRQSDEEGRAHYAKMLERLNLLPIPFVIHLDGDPQKDFVNLQLGRKADATHMFSLKIQKGQAKRPEESRLALEVARVLHREDSPFRNLIRFDSRTEKLPLPVSTLCAAGSSDLATSLVGLAAVGLAAEPPLDAEELAGYVIQAACAVEEHQPQLFDDDKVLTPVPKGGTKGAATMLVGMAIVAAFADDRDGELVADAASRTLDHPVNGGMSSSTKRRLMAAFAKDFFSDHDCPKHEGVPLALLEILSPGSFGLTAVKSARKKPNVARRAKMAEADKKPRSKKRPSRPERQAVTPADVVNAATPEEAYEASERLYDEVYGVPA